MALTTFIKLTPIQVGMLNAYRSTVGHTLEPVPIRGGEDTGGYVLPMAVLADPAHEAQRMFLHTLPLRAYETDVIFPPEEGA